MNDVSLFRLYVLRALYLFIVVGLGFFVWPDVIGGGARWDVIGGQATCMLAAFSILCLLGIRYPLQVLPVLLWEMAWKTLWLVLVPLPQWMTGHVDEAIKPSIFACSMVLLVYLATPWRYVFERYVVAGGARWW